MAKIKHPLSGRAKDLIAQCLNVESAKRPTATQALSHTWFTTGSFLQKFKALEKDALKYWHSRPMMGKLIQRLPERSMNVHKSAKQKAPKSAHALSQSPREEDIEHIDSLMANKAAVQPLRVDVARDEDYSVVHEPAAPPPPSAEQQSPPPTALKVSPLRTNHLSNVPTNNDLHVVVANSSPLQPSPQISNPSGIQATSQDRILDSISSTVSLDGVGSPTLSSLPHAQPRSQYDIDNEASFKFPSQHASGCSVRTTVSDDGTIVFVTPVSTSYHEYTDPIYALANVNCSPQSVPLRIPSCPEHQRRSAIEPWKILRGHLACRC